MPQASGADVSQGPVTLSSVVARLDQALVLIEAGDALGAAAQVDAFRREWIEVEGLVKTKSSQVYADTENRMAEAYALLSRQPADLAGAWETISQMKADLAPFAQGDTYYGVFDAAIILLREGLEALLVVGALLAFLRKVGQGDKGRWIWAGGGAGVLASVLVAVIVNVAFSQAVSGENRELLEGATGLAAAAMLLYVSYWLHSKASLGAWQKYISGRTSAALARNSLLSLAVIAFLAVFREGAETVLFYIGIAPSIAARDLAVGVGVGILGLGILGVLMLTFGLRVPVRPFFLGTSLLIFYLAFKFIGTGVHALQVAGILGVTPASYLPASGVLGLFPVWETAAPQLVLLLAAGGVLLATQLRKSYPRGRPERVP
jgi:high-affinity iron transporter